MAISSNNYESLSSTSPNLVWNHHQQMFEVACDEYDYGVAKSRCVMTLRSWVCFDAWLLLVRYDVRLTQQQRLLDTADISETHSSLVEASRYQDFMSNKLQFKKWCYNATS